MKLLIKKRRDDWLTSLLALLFVLIFIARAYADAFYNSRDIYNFSSSIVKYIFMVAGMILCLIKLISNKTFCTNHYYFENGFKNVFFVVVVFTFISVIDIFISNNSTSLTINGLLYIFLAISYSFLYVNCVNEDLLYKSIVIILFSNFIFYGFSIGFSNLTFKNLINSSFKDSSSVLESSSFSGIAFALITYFCFNRKHILLTIFSVIFCILTFKRVTIIGSLFLLIVPFFINVDKKVNKKLIILAKFIFIALPVFYWYIMMYQNFFTTDELSSFTMGRSDFLKELVNKGFVSYGYYSSLDFYKDIEMDLVRILIETSFLGLIVFVNCYFNLAKNSIFSFFLMMFIFINLLFSHSLGSSFTWTIYFLIFAIDSKKNLTSFKYNISYQKYRRKL